eukprot:GHVR01123155.1.p3 GENE.GHVR01123155.1~~GHVR01123155.1.p3  ORF type:complete len:190 (+),score=15.83 GHVR01123155.1:723-1292(+)
MKVVITPIYIIFNTKSCAVFMYEFLFHATNKYRKTTALTDISRIMIITSETQEQKGGFAHRFAANPLLTSLECNVIICTYSIQTGVSVESHFTQLICFLKNNVSGFDAAFQAMSRLRLRPEFSLDVLMFLEAGNKRVADTYFESNPGDTGVTEDLYLMKQYYKESDRIFQKDPLKSFSSWKDNISGYFK